MAGVITLIYGVAAYLIFLGSFLYAVGFVSNTAVPKSIDSGIAENPVEAIIVNALLLGLFAAQHSIMARPVFKRWWTRIVPHTAERSTYVLLASLILLLLYWQWRPIPGPVWTVENPMWVAIIQCVFWLGWAVLLISTFLINHFELFGLRQALAALRKSEPAPPVFRTPLFYKWVRHPLYVGFLLAFWATPSMTWGHLLFAAGSTGYILLGIFLEERDLVAMFGDQYRLYRKQVGMLIPWRKATE
ncbi:methanethiol S-methyltransferase [Mesorhizobium neociceri]|uniref:methanethiol S-methyltransferase n=1 Tax=Mesorhizobium neociceri TaxID=1307853 RepID=A0A838B498_9HYPH|nr:methanethiol S-methyltransferase [Mesorhizobium neociceri]MBA1141456.1 isoprenylcysteine carboxylmethyltransferase family protein [Mesorhizobium neociceri]